MDLSQRTRAILSFVQAADTGSFAAAGRALGISSAAVSKNVANLEQLLRVRLMNRTTRTLNLTDEGRLFLKQARTALQALDAAVDVLAEQRSETRGRVRISTSAGFGRDHLLPILPPLLACYPALAIEVDFDDRVVDLVTEGYDLVIRGGHIADSALISRPVCLLKTVLVASPTYLATTGVPRTPEDLKHHRLITRRFLGGSVAPWNFRAHDGSITTLDTAAALTLSAPEALVQAASLGMGIAQVGIHNIWTLLQNQVLKVVLLDTYDAGTYEMVIQYPHRAFIAPRVKVTVEYLLSAFANREALHVPLSALQPYTA